MIWSKGGVGITRGRHVLLIVGLAFVVVGIAGLALLETGTLPPGPAGNTPAAQGAWIFQSGADSDGQPIAYSGGMMMPMSCAGCHGADGHGLATPLFTSPNVTYRNLTDPRGMREPDGSRGPHYTDSLIRRAIVQGSDAGGKSLDWIMPRWGLTARQSNALIAYLKTLP